MEASPVLEERFPAEIRLPGHTVYFARLCRAQQSRPDLRVVKEVVGLSGAFRDHYLVHLVQM